MLAMRFGDTDVDKDGMINEAEFVGLCDEVASLPRRFCLATLTCLISVRAHLVVGLASSSFVLPLIILLFNFF